jgi:cobalt-zinc-cadmium efflux system outer membrane protein
MPPRSRARSRSLIAVGALVSMLGWTLSVYAQGPAPPASTANASAQPPTSGYSGGPQVTPSSVVLQQSALGAPTPTHASIAASDVTAPKQTEGGPAVPPPADLAQKINLDDALRMFRARGFDLLIADAAVVSAQGDEKVAGAVPNPQLYVGYGRIVDPAYSSACGNSAAGSGCSPNQYTVGLSDQAAIEDSLSGKRHLRLRVARAALAAARLNRVDAQRTLEFQVKSAYYQVVQAWAAHEFAKKVQDASDNTLQINQERLTNGKINEGDFERIRVTKLEADQAVDNTYQSLRQAKVALAFLLGVRGRVPEFDIDQDALKFTVPQRIAATTTDTLVRQAFGRRPDLLALGYDEARADAAIALARRQRFPDIALGVQYTQTGSGNPIDFPSAIQPPTLSFSLTGNLPIFYQQQGEILKAQADYSTQALTRAKVAAQVVSDVESAFSAYVGSRTLVERMENALLASARKALDITKIQWLAGKANLTDYLDARNAFIATNVEYIQNLTNYWTAVSQLEQAVGVEMRQ